MALNLAGIVCFPYVMKCTCSASVYFCMTLFFINISDVLNSDVEEVDSNIDAEKLKTYGTKAR